MASKRVVITGASKGIGRETALALAKEGWSVAIVARGKAELEEVRGRCEASSPSVLAIDADLRSDGAERIRDAVLEAWGGLDVLINNAGVFSEAPVEDLTLEELEEAWETNAKATVLVTQALIGAIRSAGGHVINMGSRSAVMGIPGETAFCVSKAAVVGFSATLRAELKGSGVRVSCIHPGPVNTWGAEGSEADGLMSPGDVAALLVLIASSDAEFYDVRFGMPEEDN